MRRDKVIGRVVVVMDTKIAKSGDVRTCIYPAGMRRGKVIGRVVVFVDTKIAKSGDVRT